jgi:arylsulfatase A-like enzyme
MTNDGARHRPGSNRVARHWVLLACGLVVLTALSSCASHAATGGSARAARPNIVFILTDDLSNNLMQYMPHVLALEDAGTTFTNYTVTDSLCCPSRSSIFSGKFPHDTGVFTNTGSDGGFDVFHNRGEEASTFATALQKVGYRTAMMGKYLNGYLPAAHVDGPTPYVPPGWTEWDVAGNAYSEFNYNLNENHRVVQYGSSPADYLTDVISSKASAFIDASAEAHRPFMIEVATFAPHSPYVPAPQDAKSFPGLKAPRTPAYDTLPSDPPSWLAGRTPLTEAQQTIIDADFRRRVQDVQSVDRMIANLEATLTADGEINDTDIFFSSDNGYHMGEYRLTPGKMTAFDTDINVPLVVAGPNATSGQTVTLPAENVDLGPTFEALGGAAILPDVDGHSLLSLLTSGDTDGWRNAALVEHHGPDTVLTDPDYPPDYSGNPPSYSALRTTTYTYVEYVNGNRELYDRTTDFHELHNIVGRVPAAKLRALHNALHALTMCHGAQECWAAGHQAPALSPMPGGG